MKTQSTPAQRYIEPNEPATHVRTITIPASVIMAAGFGCMAIALIGALAGAFTR